MNCLTTQNHEPTTKSTQLLNSRVLRTAFTNAVRCSQFKEKTTEVYYLTESDPYLVIALLCCCMRTRACSGIAYRDSHAVLRRWSGGSMTCLCGRLLTALYVASIKSWVATLKNWRISQLVLAAAKWQTQCSTGARTDT
eukprot:4638307-Amphidinium_carterae.1